jgi:type II secretory pathway pseudopilin PulG
MVVVVIIGVMAALAVPSLRLATFDRHAYEDAGAISQLFRDARLRSVARGSAVLVTVSASGTTDRGTFKVYEAVGQDPNDPTHSFQMPVALCKAPQSPWNLAAQTAMFVEGLNLNGIPGTAEYDGDIETQLFTYVGQSGSTPAGQVQLTGGTAYICYTPLGRSYFNATTPNFTGLAPSTTVFEARVSRGLTSGLVGASVRSVIVEPNGMPRILTKTL